jgi:hypothetical protein
MKEGPMTKAITIKDTFNIENLDIMNIDVSEFEELAKSFPKDTNIDIGIAETLAQQYLRAADRCSEILSSLILYESKTKSQKNSLRNRLYLQAKDEGYKTVEDRKAYSESHEDYVKAEEVYSVAFATRKYFDMRYDYFLKAHQYMKEKLRSENKLQMSSGFSETAGHGNGFGEKNW